MRVAGAGFGDMPLSGSVKGRTRQVGLLPLLVDEIDNASGELALDFTVAGRVAAPSLEGEARLSQGSLDFYQANLRLRDLQSTVRLKATSLTLDAEGKAGEGSLAINGGLRWQDRVLNGELHLTGDRLLVADVPEARVFASPDLRFKLADGRIDVTGEVVIPGGAHHARRHRERGARVRGRKDPASRGRRENPLPDSKSRATCA